ncbi:MAG: ABC transporter ATP-binding protein [Chloroflexota bacterium]
MGQLVVNHIVKRLGDNLVVDDVSFTVEEGEFFVLLGPSGSGKSTLLRVVCGLEAPDSGDVLINGRNVTRLPPRERNLGMVFQDYGLYPNMSVYSNIAYGLEARGVNKGEIEKRIQSAAEKLGLTEHLKNNIVDLSGGEQQRVALARALVKDADVYLFDEPLSNLDPKLRHKARRDIMVVHREKLKPTIYVTHDQAEAFAMGQRIAVLARGKLQQIGTTEQLINEPASIFVAGFIGSPSVNLIAGSIRREGSGYVFVRRALSLPLPGKWTPILSKFGENDVIAGLRPDILVRRGTQVDFEVSDQNSLSGTIEFIEPLLGETIVGVKLSDGVSISAALQEIWEAAPGDSIELAVDLNRIMLFDPKTELSLLASG